MQDDNSLFAGKLSQIIALHATVLRVNVRLREKFCNWLINYEIHESFPLQMFCHIKYTKQQLMIATATALP